MVITAFICELKMAFGKHPSEETKRKISLALLGVKHTAERIEKSRLGHPGREHELKDSNQLLQKINGFMRG